MEPSVRNLYVKKHLMFHIENDHYFIIYNLLNILNGLKCTDEKNCFIDYTKIAYILPFVGNQPLLNVVSTYRPIKITPNYNELTKLTDAYLSARIKTKMLSAIVLNLSQRGIICLRKNVEKRTVDVWLNEVPKTLLDKELFHTEGNRLMEIKKLVPHIRIMTKSTLVQRLFGDMGVQVWDD